MKSFILLASLFLTCSLTKAEIIAYPPLPKNLYQSDRYQVMLSQGGTHLDSYVYRSLNNEPKPSDASAAAAIKIKENHWTSFDFTSPVQITVTDLKQNKGGHAVIRPLSKNIKAETNGSVSTFTIQVPGQYYVDLEGEYDTPLFIFANAPETKKNHCGGKVICYGPGVHQVGDVKLTDGMTAYLEAGSYVKGRFVLSDQGAASIEGRGILSGIDYPYTHEDWSNPKMVDGSQGHMNLKINGITITDGPGPVIVVNGKAEAVNVKLMAWPLCSDGFSGFGAYSLLADSFLKVRDDIIHVGNPNTIATHNVVWQQSGGSVLQISWNNSSDIVGGVVSGLDVIASDPLPLPKASETVYNHDLVNAQNFKGTSAKKKVSFKGLLVKDVNVESRLLQVFGLQIKGQLSGYTEGLGEIAGLKLQNIKLLYPPILKSVFNGNGEDQGGVSGVVMDHVYVGEKQLTKANENEFLIKKGTVAEIIYQ